VKHQETLHPPALATALLALSAARAHRVHLLGDLEEEFRALARTRGEGAARRWYWSQTLRSLGFLFLERVRPTRSLGATAAGAVAAIGAASILGLALGRVLGSCVGLPLPVVVTGVTMVALVASISGSCASTLAAGRPDRWALGLVAFLTVAPEVVYVASLGVPPLAPELVPLAAAVLATSLGLLLGGRLSHVVLERAH
jgi:hypothetical protein